MMSWPWPTDASSNMSSATVAAFSEEMQPLEAMALGNTLVKALEEWAFVHR